MGISPKVPNNEKEQCAVTVMRVAISDYARKHGLTFDEVFFLFTASRAYEDLFNFETELWKEGPDYLMYYFEQCEKKKNSSNATTHAIADA